MLSGNCILTTYSIRNSGGYGQRWWHGKNQYTHRVAWEQTHGPIPNGMLVCHKCNNPPCVNPSHLYLGTKRDNYKDAANVGAILQNPRRGEQNGNAKFTWKEARKIRILYKQGASYSQLAKVFKVTKTTIYYIVKNKHWKEIA